jgi:hypothetical protein
MKPLRMLFASLALGCITVACSDDVEETPFGMYLSGSVNISIQNKSGADLLDPGNPDALKFFKVYYLIDGKKQLYSEPLMSAPNGYIIEKFPLDTYYHIQVFLNAPAPESNNEGAWTTYLEFEDGHTDTIEALYTVKPGYIAIEQASYNGVPTWDLSKNNGGLQTYVVVEP